MGRGVFLVDTHIIAMDLYRLTLFLHLLTLIIAAAVTAITKLAVGRRAQARTVGEMLDWHRVLVSASAAFPVCLLAFTATGVYMVITGKMNPGSGFIVAGLIGVVLLFASGITLGIKAKGLRRMLEAMAAKGPDQPAPRLTPPFLVVALPTVNTGVAIAVVFDMVMKPGTITGSLGVLLLGIALGILPALRSRNLAHTEREGEQLGQRV